MPDTDRSAVGKIVRELRPHALWTVISVMVASIVMPALISLWQKAHQASLDWKTLALLFSASLLVFSVIASLAIVFAAKSHNVIHGLLQAAERSTNEFERGQYAELARQYKQMSEEKVFEVALGPGNAYFMQRAMRTVGPDGTIEGITAYPPDAWNNELAPYLDANKEACARGVTIKGIFVLKDLAHVNQYVAMMGEHQRLGVEVHYAFRDEFSSLQGYFDQGFYYDCALFDGVCFGYDAKTESLTFRHPAVSRFTWNEGEIRQKSPFPAIWKSRQHIHRFDNTSQIHINNHFNSKGK